MTIKNIIITLIFSILGIIILFFVIYKLYFLRNPKRIISKGNNLVSPADGKVFEIIKISNKKHHTIKKGKKGKILTLIKDVGKSCYLISIELKIGNVHYQRSPLAGKILKIKHYKGKFKNAVYHAKNLKATLQKEKNEILMETSFGKIKIIQIAGLIARRIKCFVKKGQNIKKGDTLGVIKLGSQVSLIMPSNIKLLIKEGQKVKAGETIIAKL